MILNIGHRGFGVYCIENSLSAINKAIENKLDMVEIDVRLTKDEEVVVFHDPNLKRLGFVKHKIEDLDYESVKKMRIFSKKKTEDRHELIPSLREVLELCCDRIPVNIEIKHSQEKNLILIKKVIALIQEYNMLTQIIISSFQKEILSLVNQENDQIRCGFIFHKKPNMKKLFNDSCSLYSIHPHKMLTKKKLIKNARENSIKVFPWTVNSAQLMKKMISLEVDGIITNYPLKLANILISKELM